MEKVYSRTMFDLNHLIEAVMWILAVIISLTVHEFAHAAYADWAGDPTPRRQGRVTLNPLAHLDPLGTALIVFVAFFGYGFGWGKPVPVNPAYFRHLRRDWMLTAFVGPLSNIILAVIFAFLLRTLIAAGVSIRDNIFVEFLFMLVLTNVTLAVFNMIPLHPLDGSKVLSGFLPDVFDRRYWNFQMVYGQVILLVSLLALPLLNLPNPLFMAIAAMSEVILRLLFR